MRSVGAFVRITRLDTATLVFLVVFVPIYWTTEDGLRAAIQALPILTICISGYILNDLHDLEIDRENHPWRPLPSGHLSPTVAAVLYFTFLGISLAAIKAFVPPQAAYLYLLFLVAFVNYDYIINHFAYLKTFYVAAVATLPILILSAALNRSNFLSYLIPATVFLMFGRELLMDILDEKGDDRTLVKFIGNQRATFIAYVSLFIGTSCLLVGSQTLIGRVLAIGLYVMDVICAFGWRESRYRRIIIYGLKLQTLAGVYYLIE